MADEQTQSLLAEDFPAQEAVGIDSFSAHPWTGEPQATVLNDSDAGDDGKDHVVEEVTKGVANVEALEESPTSLQEATTSDSSLQDEQQPYGADEGEDDSTAACVNGVGNPKTSSHDDPEVAEEREDSVEENPTALEEEKLALQEATSLLKLPLEKDLGPLMTPTSMVAELSSPASAEAAASQDNLLHAGTGENLWLGHNMETGPSPLNAAEEVLLESGALFESAATDSPCSIESPIHQEGTLPVESAPLESPHSDVESPLTPADLESHGLVQEAADVSQEEPLSHHEEPQPARASEDAAAAKLVEPAADRVEPTELEADREEEQLVPSVAFVSEVEPVPELAICPHERLLGDLAFELTPPATPQQAEGCVLAQPSCAGTSGEEGALPQPELATSQPPEREDGAHTLEPVPAGEPVPASEPAVESTLKPKASSLPQSKTMTPVKTKGVGLASSKRPAGTPVTSTSKKPRPEVGVASPATAAKRSPLVTAKSATAAKASPTAGANKDPKSKLAMEGKAVPKPLEKRVPTTRIHSTTTTAATKPATDTPPRAATARMAAKTTTSILKAAPPSLATAKRTVATGVKGEPKREEKLTEPKKLTRPSVKLSGARPKVASTATTDTKGPVPAGASSIARARPATTPGRHGLGATMSSRNAVVAPTPSGGTERKPAPSSATAARTGPLAKATPMANRTTRPTTAPEARAASSHPGAPIENGKPNAVPGRLSKDASARAPARTGVMKSTTTKVTVKKVETDGTKPTLATEVNKSTSLTATKTTVVRTQLKTAGKVDGKNTSVAATNRKPPLERNTGKLAPKTPTPKKSVGGSKAENHKPSPIKSPSTNGPSDDALAVENGNVAEQGSDGVGGHGGSPVRQNGNALSPGVEENANEHHDAPAACEEEAQSGNPQLEEPIHEQQPQPVEVEQN
ncbi:putative nuclear envelope pore membrane protein POM 121B isoform X2 [Lethenteron reissneri]|uniref:putative nuclear envelope pore membrane protein POM 121B isoform X2 n=1 Tax=Lethenteron reissneri TaxID=7753 RepID=UPI002AB770EA|nr:putative nuclear envelope pore membrane protein POM 121B isoform X2 [Lethenteron reissneri]